MKVIPGITERYFIYNKAAEYIYNNECLGICKAIQKAQMEIMGVSFKWDWIEIYFPEFKKRKPVTITTPGTYWWSTREKNIRLSVLYECSKELEGQIKILDKIIDLNNQK